MIRFPAYSLCRFMNSGYTIVQQGCSTAPKNAIATFRQTQQNYEQTNFKKFGNPTGSMTSTIMPYSSVVPETKMKQSVGTHNS
jgi:hypothetical protein